MLRGFVLTFAYRLHDVFGAMERGGYDTLKIVTGWGLDGGWTPDAMRAVCERVPNLVVRTVSGDPSFRGGSMALLNPDAVAAELAPWYEMRRKVNPKAPLFFELGNEPNVARGDNDFIWSYRWHLNETIDRLRGGPKVRGVMPDAKLIAPAVIFNDMALGSKGKDYGAARFIAVNADVMRRCDYIGGHFYEHTGFARADRANAPTTGHLTQMLLHYRQFFADRPWFVTEYGINDPRVSAYTKGERYAKLLRGEGDPALPVANIAGALHYHFCQDAEPEPQYHVAPLGDVAFKAAS